MGTGSWITAPVPTGESRTTVAPLMPWGRGGGAALRGSGAVIGGPRSTARRPPRT
ncbi:hypothetical protein ABZ128_15610 [Streptomyces sp. NPDC006326]|uniref:hypothetical protein n=1 Tax=Streptomyces sp. NPDC006326 TaxID=3156752 RepID=UPI0033B60C1B